MWDLIVSVPDHCLSFYFGGLSVIAVDDLYQLKPVGDKLICLEEEEVFHYQETYGKSSLKCMN